MTTGKIKNSSYFILLLALALIVAGFFIFTPEAKRNDIFWLNLVVACLVYTVNHNNIFGLFSYSKGFDKQIAGMGMRWVYSWIYSLLALAGVIFGFKKDVNFDYQLYYQLICLFILVVTYYLSFISSHHATSYQDEEKDLREGKEKLLELITKLELIFSRNLSTWEAEKKQAEKVKENVRFMTACNNPTAKILESEIITEVENIIQLVQSNEPDRSRILEIFTRCNNLIAERKKIYSL